MTTVISARTLGVTGLVLILVAGLLVGAGWGLQRRLIYFPEPSSVPPVSDVLPGAREVRLRTSDGLELGAWLVPATGSGRDVTVLVASGNAVDRSLRAPLAAALSRAGMTVLPAYLGSRDASWTAAEPFVDWWTRHPELHRRAAA